MTHSSDENEILVRLFRHNVWANEQMVSACRGLTDEQLATEVTGTFGRVARTLTHLARAEGGYLRTLSGWEVGAELRVEYDPFAGVDRVAAHLQATGERLIDVAREESAGRTISGDYDGEPYVLPSWVMLLQAAYHATEHRQQIATSLTHLGVAPPEPDVWTYWDSIRGGEVPRSPE